MGLDPNMVERRKAARTRVIDSQLITVDLGDGNSGLMVDAAEWGIAVQAVAAPPVGSQRSVSFQLPGGNVRMSATGRIAWKDNSNQLGIHFVEISDMQRKIMRKWLEQVERETTEAMIEWDVQSSGKAVVVPEEAQPAAVVTRPEPIRPSKPKFSEVLPEPLVPERVAPERTLDYSAAAGDPFTPSKRKEFEPEPEWDPFARPKRESPRHDAEPRHHAQDEQEFRRVSAAPPQPASQPSASASTLLTEYEQPRYYPPTPPSTQLPEGAVAVVEPPKLAPKSAATASRELTARARFEKWVIEKHEGSKVEKIKTAFAVLFMLCGIWLFIKLLPPIAAEIKYDWNKFAVAFSFPVIGDGLTGPPSSSMPQIDLPVSVSQPKAATEATKQQAQSTRASGRKVGTGARVPPTTEASGVVFVPSFGAGTSSYRLRLADGIAPGKLLYQVKPVYPEVARLRRPDPRVALRAVVDASGRVVAAQVIRGDQVLSAAAIQAIRQWRYEPYRVAGKPVEVETRIDIDFSNLR